MCGLKLATRCGFGVFWERLCCRPRSACVLPEANWYELLSVLQIVIICARLRGVWERLRTETNCH